MKKLKLLFFTIIICLISCKGFAMNYNKIDCTYKTNESSSTSVTLTLSSAGVGDTVYLEDVMFFNEGELSTLYSDYKLDNDGYIISDEFSCPEGINIYESEKTFSLHSPYIYKLVYSQKLESFDKTVLCTERKTENFCRRKEDYSCVWVDKEDYDFLEKGYCNVDNLLYVGCGGASDIPMQIPRLISLAVNLLKIATPIILIFISIITLIKAMSGQKEDEIKKATNALVKKIIAAALVFFIVSIVQFIVSMVAKDEGDYNDFENCLDCFLNNNCETSTYYKTIVAGEEVNTSIKTSSSENLETDKTNFYDNICESVNVSENGYYNIGDKYKCKVNDTEAYNFYVLSVEHNKINLILEANVNEQGVPIYSNSYIDKDNASQSWWHESGKYDEAGPVTAFEYLNSALSGWTNIPNIQISYSDESFDFHDNKNADQSKVLKYGAITTKIDDEKYITKITKRNGNVSGTFTNLKARLPRVSELSAAGCGKYIAWTYKDGKYQISDNPYEKKGTCPLWLVDYLSSSSSYSSKKEVSVFGYWTLASGYNYRDITGIDPSENPAAWAIHYDGLLVYNAGVNQGGFYGIRPVISLPISAFNN